VPKSYLREKSGAAAFIRSSPLFSGVARAPELTRDDFTFSTAGPEGVTRVDAMSRAHCPGAPADPPGGFFIFHPFTSSPGTDFTIDQPTNAMFRSECIACVTMPITNSPWLRYSSNNSSICGHSSLGGQCSWAGRPLFAPLTFPS
jgi:hypothetical protein